ncbi:MAG: CAP domain-containing protein [Crocinitomicaceae bacterium]
MKKLIFIFSVLIMFGLGCSFQIAVYIPAQPGAPIIDKKAFVDRHNYYRKKVGVPPVVWDDDLAAYADKWAQRLALKCEMKHRSKDNYGENIYWHSGESNEVKVVDKWAAEEKYFNHNDLFYRKGKSSKYGHYSQIIWRKTKRIGAAVRTCKNGGQIWVCNYDPPGNYVNQKIY